MKVKSEKLSPQTCSWLWQFWYRTVYNISVSAQQHALCNKKMKINKMYKIEQEIRSVELGVCPMQLFFIWNKWRSSSSKSAAVYKISWKSDDFAEIWRYNDFQNSGRPPSWNRFTTIWDHPRSRCCWPQLPVKFHVNLIHKYEDIAIWIFRIFGF